jgi:hypothetical protein
MELQFAAHHREPPALTGFPLQDAKTSTVKPDYFEPVGHVIYQGLANYSEGKKRLHM